MKTTKELREMRKSKENKLKIIMDKFYSVDVDVDFEQRTILYEQKNELHKEIEEIDEKIKLNKRIDMLSKAVQNGIVEYKDELMSLIMPKYEINQNNGGF
jgi:hypothetical protein